MRKIANFVASASIFAIVIFGVLNESLAWIPIFATISTPAIVLSQETAWHKTGGKAALVLGSLLVGLLSYALFFGLGRGISFAFV